MNYQHIIIPESCSILDALNKLNLLKDVSRLILFVKADKNESIIGSLTDGDIRRSLIKDRDLNKKVGEICNNEFYCESESEGFISLQRFRDRNIKILPLLDKNQNLRRVIDLEKTRSVLPLECVIMAGGRGKRLSPLTDSVPKPMLLLNGKPIIEYNIDRLISFGIKKIYVSVNYLGEQIESYFGDRSSKGVKIEYIWENKPLGTAGSLSLVSEFETNHIILMNSDLFTNVDFEKMYLKLIDNNADMVVASSEYKVDIPFAIFETENEKVLKFKEKPSYMYHSNSGIYLFKKEWIKKIPENTFFDITDLMNEIINDNKLLLHDPIRGYWIDIGKPEDYQRAKEFVKRLK